MTEPCRIDVWLWRARFYKTRALSAAACEAGHIRLERQGQPVTRVEKAAQGVRPGDRLIFAVGSRVVTLQITGLGERRGPAPEAQSLYRLDV